MKKKFKLIVPSFLTLIFCLLLIAGSTYAIFSSQDQASIEVTSGKVELTAVFGTTTVYSAEADDNIEDTADNYAGTASAFGVTSKYKYVEQTEVASINEKQFKLFVNKNGGANLTGGDLTLLNMTPGDRVDANLTITNSSNVDIKYRVMCAVASGYDSTILEALEVKANGVDLTSSVRNWTTLPFDSANSPKIVEIPVSVVLPIETINKYQGMNTKLVFTVQAVQANAKTLDDVVNVEITKHIDQEEVTTVLESLDKKAKAEVPNSAVSTATSLTLTVEEKAVGSVTLQSNQGQKAFDVDVTVTTVTGNDVQQSSYNNPDKPIKVTLNVGTGLVGVELWHKHGTDAAVKLTKVNSLTEVDEAGEFYYDSTNGTITYMAVKFSEYTVTYVNYVVIDEVQVPASSLTENKDGSYSYNNVKYEINDGVVSLAKNKLYGFYDSYVVEEGEETEHWVHEISNKAEFRNILSHINKSAAGEPISGVPYDKLNLGNENTEYIFNKSEIDLSNLWSSQDATLLATNFVGKLSGVSTKTTIKNISHEQFGLFKNIKDSSFKNIIFDNCTLESENQQQVGLINSFAQKDSTILIENVIVNDTCSIHGTKNVAAFLGYGSECSLTFKNCINNADVTADDAGAGAFATNVNTGTLLKFEGCVNNGHITAKDFAGGFVRYGKAPQFISCVNNGIVELSGTSGTHIGVFMGQTDQYTGYSFEGTSVGSKFRLVLGGTNYTNASSGSAANTELSYSTTTQKLVFNSEVNVKDFINQYLVEKIAPTEISITGLYAHSNDEEANAANLAIRTLSLDLSALTNDQKASITSYKLTTKVSSWYVDYDINATQPGQSGNAIINITQGNVEDIDNFTIPRLLYVGNTYPTGKAQPQSNWIVDHGGNYEYDFDWFKIDSNCELPLGYNLLSDGSAYMIHDNINVIDGRFNVTAKLPSHVEYSIIFYDANGQKIAECDSAIDLWIGSGTALKKISEIPSNVSVTE